MLHIRRWGGLRNNTLVIELYQLYMMIELSIYTSAVSWNIFRSTMASNLLNYGLYLF